MTTSRNLLAWIAASLALAAFSPVFAQDNPEQSEALPAAQPDEKAEVAPTPKKSESKAQEAKDHHSRPIPAPVVKSISVDSLLAHRFTPLDSRFDFHPERGLIRR